MHPVPELIPELVLYDGGIWIRPRTYDRQIVKESRSYLRLAPDANDVLLDIGANIGAASRRFLNAGVRQVIAVEPEPVNFSILRKNLAAAPSRSVAVEAAVAASEGDCELWIHAGRNKGMHSLVPQNRRRALRVRAVTLQRLMMRHRPTLIKIDIEGGEYQLLAPLSVLPAHVRGIALELHLSCGMWRSECGPAIVSLLAEQGFSAVRAPRFDGHRPCTLGIWLR